MTQQQTLTYMATDVIGFSYMAQQDQHKAMELLEIYQSILIPLIENEGGSSIVCTGDAISACFTSCSSAIKAGFAIQLALEAWNNESTTTNLTTRIGIHASKPGDKGYLQQLSKTLAENLESLGSANAICVSSSLINGLEMENGSCPYCYPLGSRSLDYLPEPLEIYYLFEKKPVFFSRLGLQFKSLQFRQGKRNFSTHALAAIALLMILAPALFYYASPAEIEYIEFSETIDFNDGGDVRAVHDLSSYIKTRLDLISGLKLIVERNTRLPVSQLICSFQQSGNNVRLSWGIIRRYGEVQTSGGVINGNIDTLEEIKKQLVDNIVTQIHSS